MAILALLFLKNGNKTQQNKTLVPSVRVASSHRGAKVSINLGALLVRINLNISNW